MKILDIGCGKKKYQSKNKNDVVVGLDIAKLPEVDVVHNLEKFPWPFKNNEFDLIISNHVLEHMTDLIKVMEEIHRIGKPGALVKINVPYFAYPGSYQDPTHKRFFTLHTFDYFSEDSELNYYSKARFKILKIKLTFDVKRKGISKIIDPFINHFRGFYERFLSSLLPAHNLYAELKIIK